MRRRPRRSGFAIATALVLLAASTLVTVVAVQLIAGERPWVDYDAVASFAHGTRWDEAGTVLAGAAVALAGLILLAAAVLPGRPTVLPLAGDHPGMDSGASRRSLRSTLRGAASAVDGVRAAKLRLTARRAVAVVRTNRTNATGLDAAVAAAVTRRLDQITPARRPAVKVRVRSARGAR